MKKLPLISLTILLFSCQKEIIPPPCYFVDVNLKEMQGANYSLRIGENPVDSWMGDTLAQTRSFEVTQYYEGKPFDFRIRAYIDLHGPNIDGINYYSDVYRDSVRVESPELIQIGDQTSSGSIWVHREGGRNIIKVRNSLECASQARLVYNGRDTTLNLASIQAGTAGGSDYRFETEDSIFNITFQLLTPCEFWPRELMRVSSSSIQPFDFSGLKIGVRKETDCNTNQY